MYISLHTCNIRHDCIHHTLLRTEHASLWFVLRHESSRAVAGCCFRHPGPRPKHQCPPAPHRREKGVLDLCLRCLKHEGGLPSPEYHLGHGHRYPLPSRGSTQRRDGRLQRGRSWLRSWLGSRRPLCCGVEAQRWAVAAQALSAANKRNKVTWWAVAAVRIELT